MLACNFTLNGGVHCALATFFSGVRMSRAHSGQWSYSYHVAVIDNFERQAQMRGGLYRYKLRNELSVCWLTDTVLLEQIK